MAITCPHKSTQHKAAQYKTNTRACDTHKHMHVHILVLVHTHIFFLVFTHPSDNTVIEVAYLGRGKDCLAHFKLCLVSTKKVPGNLEIHHNIPK